jgi:dTDP-4-amino-4,6-dideoxygalactose transaminase
MYIIGQEEIDAVARIVRSKELFRYGIGHECERFEARYAAFLGAKHFSLAASGSYALTAAMIGLGIGPGDEVLVPAHTYMASATSVLAAGAIPVIVDINESITIDPAAIEAAIGPRTRAVIAVHMWGTTCDMDAIMEIAQRRKVLVIEDACQAVGGSYKGRKLGTIGDIGAFSFNFYKNMSCGEGGGVVTNDDAVSRRVNCAIDPCHAFWTGRSEDAKPFAGNGARASEFMGAILNVQLDRIEGIIGTMRRERDTRVHRDLSERDRGQDGPAHLHRMGSGIDGRGRCASAHESLHDAGERGVPKDLFEGYVRPLSGNPEPHYSRADAPAAHGGGNGEHHSQHQGSHTRGARRRQTRRSGRSPGRGRGCDQVRFERSRLVTGCVW